MRIMREATSDAEYNIPNTINYCNGSTVRASYYQKEQALVVDADFFDFLLQSDFKDRYHIIQWFAESRDYGEPNKA